MKICHVTTVHSPDDIRIRQKEVNSLSEFFDVKIIINTNEEFIDIDNMYIKVKKSGNRILRFLNDGYHLYKVIKKEKFDIVHFHDPDFIFFGYLLKKQGAKVIYDSHEDVPRAILSKYWIPKKLRKVISFTFELLENFFSKRFDYIITATPFIKKRFIKINDNTEVINNYPLLNELQINKNEKVTKDNQVAYVGGLNPIRGSKYLALASSHTKNKIKIAGTVHGLEFPANLELLGTLDRTEVKNLLSKSIAGLVTFLPEPNHINAKPNKMFEYMSASLPIICSNFDEWQELIIENNNGIVVDPTDPIEIAAAIDYLIDNPDVATEMGKNSRESIEQKYNWEKESEKLIEIYNKIIKEIKS